MKAIRTLTLGAMFALFALPMAAQPIPGCSEELQEEMREPVALYQMNWKQYAASNDERYLAEAYPNWKLVVEKCPRNGKNIYTRGVTILKSRFNNAQTDAEREAAIDELVALYNTRIANYGNANNFTAMAARDIDDIYGDGLADNEQALKRVYQLYSQAAAMEGGLDAGYVVKFMETTIKYVGAGYAEPTLVVDNYDIASDLLEDELQKNIDDSVKAATIRGYIAGVEQAFSPYASCEQLVEIYGKRFEADPENIELLKKITGILSRKGCTDQELFYQATDKLHQLEPTPTTAMRMAQMYNSKKNYSEAIKYLKDAVELLPGKEKYNAYMQMGVAYFNLKNFSAARSAYNSAAAADPTKGAPYRMIAQLYAASSESAREDNVDGRSVYWAAVDALLQSKRVDPSPENVEACDRSISSYSDNFPKQAAAFMAGLENGNKFTVPGWIGVTTKVRTR